MATYKKFIQDPIRYANEIQISLLEKYLRHLSELYYNSGKSPVSDIIFDELKDILRERDSSNPFLDEVGAPVEKNKIKLPFPMGSLNKVKPDNGEFEKWIKIYNGPYELSDKMDGISAMIYNENGNIKMCSRGDGIYGQDITELLKYMEINTSQIPNNVAIRGELIMTKENFKKIDKEMSNARNAVAGIVNSKTKDKTYANTAKLIDFITYNIINPRYKQDVQYEKLKEWDLNVVHHKEVTQITKEMLKEYFLKRREKNAYEIDGIVVMDNNMVYDIVE